MKIKEVEQLKGLTAKKHSILYLFPAAIAGGIISFIFIILVYVKVEEVLFAPQEWLFYQINSFGWRQHMSAWQMLPM